METGEHKIYTIDDIAKELGVSKTTVSRAISGKGRISAATREKVLAFVREHDYRPNVMAKGLAQRKTYNIGMSFPMEYEATEIPFFKDCLNGICEVASANNYDILISMARNEDLSQIVRMVENHKVDGVILSRTIMNSAAQQYLKQKGIPLVVIGPTGDKEVISVDNRNYEASKELTELLLMKGVHRLALLGGDESFRVTESRCQGFLDAYRESGLEADTSLLFMGINTYMEAMYAVEHALEAKADGIVCMDDVITMTTLGCLREKGVSIPEDMKLASFYDSWQLENNLPSITSLKFDSKALGQWACRKMLELLGEDTGDPRSMSVPSYQVILRESTK